MPHIGLGTWPMDDDEAALAVAGALRIGYRLIDTAENYENERGVGEGIRNSGIDRAEVFVTTKFNRKWHSIEGARQACEASLARLGPGLCRSTSGALAQPRPGSLRRGFRGHDPPAPRRAGARHRYLQLQAGASTAPVRSGPDTTRQPEGSKAQVYETIAACAAQNKAVLMVSSYLPELFGMCDRLAVMSRGKLSEVRPIDQWTPETVLQAAIGATDHTIKTD